jgi:hypothetical protein
MESVIVRLRDEAVASLANAPIDGRAVPELEALALYVTDRVV